MAKDGPRGLVTLVCLTCGKERFFTQDVPAAVTCEQCGECKTHNECICEEVARQQTELDAENAEKRAARQKLIRESAAGWGLDWEPQWTDGGYPVATFGN